MNILAFVVAAIGAFITYLTTPWLIRYLRRIDLVVKDQNKEHRPLVPISGGLAVFAGFFVGFMLFIFFRTFFDIGAAELTLESGQFLVLFAGFISIFLVTIIGFLDDVLITKSKEASGGLRQWQKPFLTLIAAIPLMVTHAGTSTIYLPFFGDVALGVIYPLLFVPIGFVGAANMVNMLAGLNGLEVGMGIIYLGSLGFYAFVHNQYIAALLALLAFTSLCAFWFYNKTPAKILPGDSLTYFLGGTLASVAILGNLEKAALIISIPFFVEFFLKLRSRFTAASYGIWVHGNIQSKYDTPYSVTHLFMKNGNYTEKQITYFIFVIQAFFAALIWVI